MKVNKKRSREIASLIQVEEQRCFANCWWGIRHTTDGVLCVGQVVFDGTAYRHAWLEEGRFIIEPTLVGLIDIAKASYRPLHRWICSQLRKLPVLHFRGSRTVQPVFNEWYSIPVRDPDERDER